MKFKLFFLSILFNLYFYGQPLFYAEKTSLHYENVIQKSEVNGEFIIENRGTEALELLEVTPYCNCTILSMPKVIAPGAKEKIVFTVTPKIGEGDWRTVIKIKTNEPKDNIHRLNITMNVIPLIKFEEEAKGSLVLLPGDEMDTTIKVFSPAKITFSILDFSILPEDSAIIEPISPLDEKVTPDKNFIFKIKSKKPLQIGDNFFKIKLKTDIENLPIFGYILKVKVKDYIYAEPDKLSFKLNTKPGIIQPAGKNKFAYLKPDKNTKPNFNLKEKTYYKVLNSIQGWYQISDPESNLILWIPWEDSIVIDDGFQASTKIFSAKNIPFEIKEIRCPYKFSCSYKKEKDYYIIFVQRWAPIESLAETFEKLEIITDHPNKEKFEIPLTEEKIEKYNTTKENIDKKLKLNPKFQDKKIKYAQPEIKIEKN